VSAATPVCAGPATLRPASRLSGPGPCPPPQRTRGRLAHLAAAPPQARWVSGASGAAAAAGDCGGGGGGGDGGGSGGGGGDGDGDGDGWWDDRADGGAVDAFLDAML
jgi:hypothetical protein